MAKTRARPAAQIRQMGVDELRASPEADALFREHWHEIALNKALMKLAPNWRRYYELEERGALLMLGAFAEVGDSEELVGYSVNIVIEHLHYAELVCCMNDVLFVTREHRHGRLGLRLIQATELMAQRRGAKLMLWHCKQGTTLDALMPRLGYGVQDIVYSKAL